MFARFCGFGPGHKSTHLVTKVFRDELKETFGLGEGKDDDDLGDIFEGNDIADEKEFGDAASDSESDRDSDWDSEAVSDLDSLTFEEELGYAPL
jgi:hypothetical protein